jgi:hypothetical protein
MNIKASTLVVLAVVGCWLVLALTQSHFRYKLAINRDGKISTIRKNIEKIQQSMDNNSNDSVTLADLRNVIQVMQREGQIRDLQTKNDIELSQSHESAFPEVLPFLALAFILLQNRMLLKQINELKPSGSDCS